MSVSYPIAYKVLLEREYQSKSESLAKFLNCDLISQEEIKKSFQENTYLLAYSEKGLSLCDLSRKKINPVVVDFVSGSANHRRLYGGGKSQMIAKAVGLKSNQFFPYVLDATAGLGGDSFVLASLGCRVTLVERNPIAYSLVKDGLERATHSGDHDLVEVVERMNLVFANSREFIEQIDEEHLPDVIYVDPMFPERKKSASVKKEMQFFHDIIGKDEDADSLIKICREKAKYRVTVKRPKIAEYLGGVSPSTQIVGKSSRFDIYANKKMPS